MGSGVTKELLNNEAKKYEITNEQNDIDLNDRNKAIEEVKRLRKLLHQQYSQMQNNNNNNNNDNNEKKDNNNVNESNNNNNNNNSNVNVNVVGLRQPFQASELLNMNDDEIANHKKEVFEAAKKREKKRKRDMKKALKANDYSKSFSGTAEDTSKEKEFADLANTSSSNKNKEENPYLAAVIGSEEELKQLRNDPKSWCKLMGANDCIIYLNCYTHEITGLRPDTFIDSNEGNNNDNNNQVETIEDLANGLQIVESDDLLDNIETAIENRKTTLILDTSKDDIMKTYFTYKGVLCDLSDLAKPLGEQRREGITPKKVLKNARKKIVQAAQNGCTLAILLGPLGQEHMSIKDKACKKPLGGDKIFPSNLLTAAGKDLLKPKVKGGKAAICKLYKKDDMEGGICVYREKFNVVFVSKHSPKTYEKELSHSLPLQRMNVIYLKVDPENRG